MATDGGGWLAPALRAQTGSAAALMAAFCAAALAGVRFGSGVQLVVLLGGIVLIGFPHGSFDHLIARPVLERCIGQRWWAPFAAGYLGLAGVVALAWVIAPAATLAGFLGASVLHFGLGDTEDGLAPQSVPGAVVVLTYGALPLLLPIAFHPAEAAPVLAALAQIPVARMQDVLRGAFWLMPLWAAAFGWVAVAAYREQCGVAERIAMAAGFVLLPPLLAFGLYFCAGHAVRHVLRLGAWRDASNPSKAAWFLVRVMAPAAMFCAAGLALLASMGKTTTVDLLAPCFRIIAALTLPHMIVTAWLDIGAIENGNEQTPGKRGA